MSLVTFRIALRALAKGKMRAGLTILGVVIGIAAVTTMVSIGESASQLVQGQIQSIGTNFLVVFPSAQRRSGVREGLTHTLTSGDSDAIARECPAVLAASPIVWASGQLIYGSENWNPKEMFGAGHQYLTVRNWPIRLGGFFSERDIHAADKVCVIGWTVVAKLFQTTNPLGQTVRIRNIPFRVVGVLEPKGANMFGDDQDDIVLLPYTTVRRRLFGSEFDNVNAIVVSAKSYERIPEAKQQIEALLADRHKIAPGDRNDFEVGSSTELSAIVGVITGTMTALLSSIAGISLLVGGVGIMNIMLVSVTERTREIGIRMAVGARPKDILRQFLVESIVLSMIGGLIGLGLGIGASVGITSAINSFTSGTEWPIVISVPAAIIAIVFATAVGVFFGYYPARRASRLDPIDALRYE
jgi:putative ABC transport system permease protein